MNLDSRKVFEQDRENIKKLKEYQKVKDKTGQGIMGVFYLIMGHKPITVPESVVDSLAFTQSTSESSEVQDEVDEVG